LYRHEQSTAPTYVGRTYANFEYNYSGTINNGLGSSSTNACTIDTLTVTQGTINFPLTTNNLPLHFVVKGDIKFNGGTFNFSPTSTTADIKIGGTVLQNIISGSGSYTFGTNSTVEMSNTNHLQLYRDLVLDGSLTLTNGQIITGAYEVYEKNNSTSAISGHSAIHSTSSNSYINGNLRRKVTTGSYQFPVGTSSNYELARIIINSNSDVDNLLAYFNPFNGGCTYASNLPSFETTPSNASHSAQITDMLNYGYFIVEPFDASKVLVSSPTINYDAEMSFNGHTNGVTLSIAPQCYTLIKRNSACSGSWSLGGGSFVSTTQQGSSSSTNVVTAKLSGLTTFSQFNTGFSSSDVLPIELLYFTAEANGNEVILNWATAIEKSSDRFEIERSLDGVNFNSIATIKGQGDKNGTSYYHTTDNISTLNTLVVYYRLKQVDKNESYSYSEIKALTFKQQISNDIQIETVYPNPFIDNIAIEITLNKASNVQYQIIDLFGRVLAQKDEVLANGNHHLQINDLNKLPKGIYLIKINTDTYSKQLRIEKL
jgi:hypothetical protein